MTGVNPTGIREYNGGSVQSALVGAITAGALSFSITPTTKWPSGAIGKFTIVIDAGTTSEESILCSSQVGGVITVTTRGYDNTTATTHAVGAIVLHVPSAIDVAETNTIANFASLTTKGQPIDADIIPGADSASSNATTNFTWANIKAYLKTYFDGFYKFAAFSIAANQAIAVNSAYYVNSATGAYTLTGPVSANLDDEIRIFDSGNNSFVNNITVNFNGLKFRGNLDTLAININGGRAYLKYTGATYGWMVI